MTGRPRIRVVMMQRDEGDVLMAWLSHYGGLFGLDALTIFDNGSQDPLTLHLLSHAERHGTIVHRHRADVSDFHGKGIHLANEIRSWDRCGGYDFALPVDCDEFLAVVGDDAIVTDSTAVFGEFERLRGERRALRIGSSLFNCPAAPGWFSCDPAFTKGFVPSRSLGVMDNGQHNPSSVLANGFALTRFTYLHWHNHPFHEMSARARRKLGNSLIDPTDRQALMRYAATPGLPGRHLVGILLEDEAHYTTRYDGTLRLYLPWARAVSGHVSTLHVAPLLLGDASGKREWSAVQYHALNPDVPSWPLGPLMHYMLYGWSEGRSF